MPSIINGKQPAYTYLFQGKRFNAWKEEVKEKFFDLAGMNDIAKNACPLNVEIEQEVQKEGYKQIRFVFESEKGAFVPCYLLIPDTGKEKYPVVITLQGHSTGFHNSIREPKDDGDAEYAMGRGAFAVQAVERGFAALAIEQRGMGERRPTDGTRGMANMCEYTAHIALLLGRTIIGERMWDVSKAIDALETFKNCLDLDKIAITGSSGGGTASYYSACFEPRIKLAAPACSVCTYESSIMDIFHCSCNFIPRAYEWFEMQDLSCLIAPRKLAVLTGAQDLIFPLEGVKKAYKTIEAVYAAAGAKENCRLVEMPKGHYWCEDIAWNVIVEESKKLGW